MTIVKGLSLVTATGLMTGCALSKWIVGNADTIQAHSEAAEGFGPYGAVVGLIGTTVVAGAKWWEHKSTTKQLVQSVEKAKKELDPKAKLMLKDSFDKHMPSKVKDVVAKVKAVIK